MSMKKVLYARTRASSHARPVRWRRLLAATIASRTGTITTEMSRALNMRAVFRSWEATTPRPDPGVRDLRRLLRGGLAICSGYTRMLEDERLTRVSAGFPLPGRGEAHAPDARQRGRADRSPALWVVVDDGSTDETPAILAEYARKLAYLRVVRRADRGRRSVGPGVIEAFYDGLETVDLDELRLPLQARPRPRPAAALLRAPDGAHGGEPAARHDLRQALLPRLRHGALVPEAIGDEMSVGASKFYRTRVLPRDRRLRPRR